MGRHNMSDPYGLSDPSGTDSTRQPPRTRRRTVAIATVLVLAVAGGTAVFAERGLLDSLGGSCDDDAVRLDVVASPDVAPALTETAQYVKDNDVTSDGRCLDIRVTGREAYKVTDTLRSSESTPDYQVWVPDSSLWVERAGGGDERVPLTAAGNIATSPVTMGMVPSAAKSLGWPDKKYSWAELTGAATSGDELRLGAADPARSATGLLALTKIGASAKKSGDDSDDGDTQVAATAKLLAERTSDSDAQALETVARDDSGTEQGNPRRNQALVVSEQSAFAHNDGAEPAGSLQLFYPEDGSPQLDYPFTLVDETRLSTDESRAALRFMALLGESHGTGILREHGFRTASGEASGEQVTAAGGSAPQPYRTAASSRPPSAKAIQETLGMWTITVQSARLSVVVDVSGSMAEIVPGHGQSRLEVTKSSLIQALSTFTPEDEIGLWEFSTLLDGKRDYRKLVPTQRLGDRTKSGITHRERLTAEFGRLQPVADGATGLYDTALASYKQAQSSYVSGKFNAVVLLTDGANEDPGSISRSGLVTELEKLADPKRPVPLIAIAVGPDADKQEVQELAEATGGSGHQVDDPAQIHEVILKSIMAAGQG